MNTLSEQTVEQQQIRSASPSMISLNGSCLCIPPNSPDEGGRSDCTKTFKEIPLTEPGPPSDVEHKDYANIASLFHLENDCKPSVPSSLDSSIYELIHEEGREKLNCNKHHIDPKQQQADEEIFVTRVIQSMLQSSDVSIRRGASHVLRNYRDRQDVCKAFIIALHEDQDFINRMHFVSALGTGPLLSESMIQALVFTMKMDWYWGVRQDAAQVLCTIAKNNKHVLSAVLGALKVEENRSVKCTIIKSYIHTFGIDNDVAMNRLKLAMKGDEDKVVLKYARKKLGKQCRKLWLLEWLQCGSELV